MKDRTTIQIEKETLKRLLKAKKEIKFGKRVIPETHDELLNRLLKKEIMKAKKGEFK